MGIGSDVEYCRRTHTRRCEAVGMGGNAGFFIRNIKTGHWRWYYTLPVRSTVG
jgi:hypothetical protein